MIKNYLKIAWRNLQRNQTYSFINVLGLALGLTCGILIFSLVKYHVSFDNFHANSDRIYRMVTEQHRDEVTYRPSVPNPLGKAFRNDYTFGEKVARIATFGQQLITIQNGGETSRYKDGVAFTESQFFDIFNYPLLHGNKKTVLEEPNTAILTERMAKKYFGNENPINKTFKLDNNIDFRVTGVLKNLPKNTDRKTEIYLSYLSLKTYNEWYASDDSWGGLSTPMQCFVLLRRNVDPRQVEMVLPAYVKKYRPTNKNVHHYKLQLLADIHFNADYDGTMTKRNLWVLSCIGLFLIITACVNFINLATAQALKRSKEVGVRKVLGSLRGQLFWQFIAETGLITVIATAIAIPLSLLTMPYVNDWFNSQMGLDFSSDWRLWIFIALLVLVVTFFAGSYPGIILSGFTPILALRSKIMQNNSGGFNTRRALIVTQFAISQILMIGMIVIAMQMRYAKQSELGFDKGAIVMIPVASDSSITMNTLKNRLSQIRGVEKVSLCYAAPSSDNDWSTSLRYDNRAEEEPFKISHKSIDDQYLSTFGLKLLVGRNILPSDTVKEFLVNETLVRKLNLKSPEGLLGKKIKIASMNAPVVGVVRDFHDQSFHSSINAVAMSSYKENYETYAVKIDLANVKTTLTEIEKTWSDMHPDQIYEHQFLDEHIAAFYETEDLMLNLIQVFSLIAIFIGCLGLYGLVSFMAAQKTKEIGIRKVLGGTVAHILWIFGRELFILLLVAFLIAAPVAWWVMNNWLQDFEFRIPVSPWIFILSILISIIVAAGTVGYRSIRAATVNPIKSLRVE